MLVAALISAPSALKSQNLTGLWKGSFTQEDDMGRNRYTGQFQIRIIKHSNNALTCITTTSFESSFYATAKAKGVYDKLRKTAVIEETKIERIKKTEGTEQCLMVCNLRYQNKGGKEQLLGSFDGYIEKKKDPCGSGEIFLTKVSSK
jgi:hypothetical protein